VLGKSFNDDNVDLAAKLITKELAFDGAISIQLADAESEIRYSRDNLDLIQ